MPQCVLVLVLVLVLVDWQQTKEEGTDIVLDKKFTCWCSYGDDEPNATGIWSNKFEHFYGEDNE